MGTFDSIWDKASKVLDRGVDGMVGDRLRYRHRGVWLGAVPAGGVDAVVAGFVINDAAALNINEVDETLGSRWRVKISSALVDQPIQSDRIQHPKMGSGWFCPAGSQIENDGRYWIFDVQKVTGL